MERQVELFGTATTATLLRRAVKAGARSHPELLEIRIERRELRYVYGLPQVAEAGQLMLLRHVEVGGKLQRAISVLKARGIQHDTALRSLSIGSNGLVVEERFQRLHGVLTGAPTLLEQAGEE